MNFSWISYEIKSNLFIWNSRQVNIGFVWSSNELLMNFISNEIKFSHMNSYAVRMKFIWTSYRRTNEVDMLYPCNTNEVHMRLINISHEIHMIWTSYTSCELHKNYMTSTQEVSLYYTWIWFLASLLCTSYEWASRPIVDSRLTPSQWVTPLQSNAVSHGLGANLESALLYMHAYMHTLSLLLPLSYKNTLRHALGNQPPNFGLSIQQKNTWNVVLQNGGHLSRLPWVNSMTHSSRLWIHLICILNTLPDFLDLSHCSDCLPFVGCIIWTLLFVPISWGCLNL